MSGNGWIALRLAGVCAAFAAGILVGRSEKSRPLSRPPQPATETRNPQPDKIESLLAARANLRNELALKEQMIESLEAELAELRKKLPEPPSAEEQQERSEEKEKAQRQQELVAIRKQADELQRKILQRKDRGLRQEGLAELGALIQSAERDELLVGLMTLSRVMGSATYADIAAYKESFKPQLVAALSNEDSEVRRASLTCAFLLHLQEAPDLALSMREDPAPEIRAEAAFQLSVFGGKERDARVASALKTLLQDDDDRVRRQALDSLCSSDPGNYDYGQEMEDVVIEMSREPEMAAEARAWLLQRRNITAAAAQRLVEMLREEGSGYRRANCLRHLGNHDLSDQAKPVISAFCIDVITESLDKNERLVALDAVRDLGETSVVPELEEISRSYDAEGIEEELVRTIEYLRKQAEKRR